MTKKPDKHAAALLVQKNQIDKASSHLGSMDSILNDILDEQSENQQLIDEMLALSGMLGAEAVEVESISASLDRVESIKYKDVSDRNLGLLDYISVNEDIGWDDYIDEVERYAERYNINLKDDPYRRLMSDSQRIAFEKMIKDDFSLKKAQCDKYDYMLAVACGLLGGIVDVVFVGAPGEGALTNQTDRFVDSAVEKFATLNGWKGNASKGNKTASAIGFLERKYKVNYDHRHGGDVDRLFKMSTRNHHIKSLGHSPDIVGLFFSILGQFTDTAHFVSGGSLITIDTETFDLKGGNFASKIFSGFVNWLGHLFSDVAGSSGAVTRGSGLPIPFYSLLQFVDVGEFGQHKQSFATVAVKVFEQGYDFRHGLAMAVPVMVTELLTRMVWVFKQKIYHDKSWGDCIPNASNPELRRMLLVAHGSLCLVDVADATLRSGGTAVGFLLRSNIIAWCRFAMLSVKELQVWYMAGKLDNDAVDLYLEKELKRLMHA